MDKTESRAVIKYLHRKGMKTKEIHDDMVKTFVEDSPRYSTVKKWLADAQMEGINCIVMDDRRLTVITEILYISTHCFNRNLGDRQTVCRMGTPKADTRPKAEKARTFICLFFLFSLY